jgi:predicted metal-binding membrane protein
MINDSSIIETVVKRDRLILIGGLVAVVLLSWVYILVGAGMNMTAFEMTAMSSSSAESSEMAMGDTMDMARAAMIQPAVWTPRYATLMFFMWWVMMIAMMLPSASPMILLFASIYRKQKEQGAAYVPTTVFAAGYLVAWGGFSLLAAAAQWGLEQLGFLSAMMVSTNGLFGGVILIVAGIYQLTPLKHACLSHCRSPVQFITQHWRKGRLGAFRMGLDHGVYCLGCCWSLMALLFVGGVMNLYWIAGLALFILLEKMIPAGHRLGWRTGIVLVAWGGWMAFGAL